MYTESDLHQDILDRISKDDMDKLWEIFRRYSSIPYDNKSNTSTFLGYVDRIVMNAHQKRINRIKE